MTENYYAGKLPILALRGITVFPDQTIHFDVGRPKSILALDACMKQDQHILLIPQKDLLVDDPKLVDLCSVGVIAHVKQVLKTQGENLRILVTGVNRARIAEVSQTEPYMAGYVESIPSQPACPRQRQESGSAPGSSGCLRQLPGSCRAECAGDPAEDHGFR